MRYLPFRHSTCCACRPAAVCSVALPGTVRVACRRGRRSGRGAFVTLFNGKDLAGWHGQETADPRKFAGSDVPRRRRSSLPGTPKDLKKHWTSRTARSSTTARAPI